MMLTLRSLTGFLLLLGLGFVEPSAHADPMYIYSYAIADLCAGGDLESCLNGQSTSLYTASFTTVPIPVVTGETDLTPAELASFSVSGSLSGDYITEAILDGNFGGSGWQAISLGSGGSPAGETSLADGITLAEYATPGTYSNSFNGGEYLDSLTVATAQTGAVPEPNLVAVTLLGIGMVLLARRRRARACPNPPITTDASNHRTQAVIRTNQLNNFRQYR